MTTPTDTALRVAVAALVLAVVATPAALSPPAAATSSSARAACQTVVTHDRFLINNDTMTKIANGGQGVSTVRNTQVRISESSAFYSLTGDNPNAYCVTFVVLIGETAIPPAELPGTVPSNDDKYEATWDATHDFNASETYTRVKFTIPGGETATFSPSRVRVVPLSWASKEPTKAEGAWEKLKDRFRDKVLTKNEYVLEPGREATLTIPLKNPDTGEKVTEYHAQYSTDGGSSWKPVGTDTEDPVFKSENADSVQFTFNDPSAKVRFVANPTVIDDAKYEIDSYVSGITDPFSGDWWPFGVLSSPAAAGVAS